MSTKINEIKIFKFSITIPNLKFSIWKPKNCSPTIKIERMIIAIDVFLVLSVVIFYTLQATVHKHLWNNRTRFNFLFVVFVKIRIS